MGRANPHIMQSRGAEPYIMNFYATQYSTSFAKPITVKRSDIPAFSGGEVFKPRSAQEYKSSGFTSNVRPQIYYNKNLDEIDNPDLSRICKENYNTITHIEFPAYELKNGSEELPKCLADPNSAFTKTTKVHNPHIDEVHNLFISKRIRAPFDVEPKQIPLLQNIHHKDPLTKKNFNYGVDYMNTEYETNYLKHEPYKLTNQIKVGPKEESGFVANKEKEDVLTNAPGERWNFRSRQTGNTMYQEKFKTYGYLKGDEPLPSLVNGTSTAENSHTRKYNNSDANSHKFGNPTEYNERFRGIQRSAPILSEKLGLATVGQKEYNGQTRCEKGFVSEQDNPERFVTSYKTKFYDMSKSNKEDVGINGNRDNGFTADAKVHNISKDFNTTELIHNIEPYQSRSIRSRDPFFLSSTHEHKLAVHNETKQAGNTLTAACV